MNPAIYSSFFSLFILFVIIYLNRRKTDKLVRILRNRKKRGIVKMSDVLNRYIGKDCVVYVSTGNYSAIEGTVTEIKDNWIVVKTKDGDEVINFDYVIRVKEHPVNKNGKKKTIFA